MKESKFPITFSMKYLKSLMVTTVKMIKVKTRTVAVTVTLPVVTRLIIYQSMMIVIADKVNDIEIYI